MIAAAWIFGGLLVVSLLVIVFGPWILGRPFHLDPANRAIIGFLCAILAGLFGIFFAGAISSNWHQAVPGGSFTVQGSGGFGGFIIMLWWWGRMTKDWSWRPTGDAVGSPASNSKPQSPTEATKPVDETAVVFANGPSSTTKHTIDASNNAPIANTPMGLYRPTNNDISVLLAMEKADTNKRPKDFEDLAYQFGFKFDLESPPTETRFKRLQAMEWVDPVGGGTEYVISRAGKLLLKGLRTNPGPYKDQIEAALRADEPEPPQTPVKRSKKK